MSTIIIQAMVKYLLIQPVAANLVDDKLHIFADQAAIEDYARINVATAVKFKLVKGITEGKVTNFNPPDNTNLAQAAVMIYEMLDIAK